MGVSWCDTAAKNTSAKNQDKRSVFIILSYSQVGFQAQITSSTYNINTSDDLEQPVTEDKSKAHTLKVYVVLIFPLTSVLLQVASLIILENQSYEECTKIWGTQKHIKTTNSWVLPILR